MLRLGFALIALPMFWATAASAATNDNPFGAADPYQACVAAVDVNAADAFEMASIWRDHGGGASAEHCIPLAFIPLDQPGESPAPPHVLARRLGAGAAPGRGPPLSHSGRS